MAIGLKPRMPDAFDVTTMWWDPIRNHFVEEEMPI